MTAQQVDFGPKNYHLRGLGSHIPYMLRTQGFKSKDIWKTYSEQTSLKVKG